MKLKRRLMSALIMSIFLMRNIVNIPGHADAPEDYSYEIIPLLAPFNQYFLVKTDNPDPLSFQFSDKDSAYGSAAIISRCAEYFADVQYENLDTLRVNCGYIFYGARIDGGEVTLQVKHTDWEDTEITVNVPEVCDVADYLIQNYATQTGFFENMDAVEKGFSSICIYSGSYIRGEIVQLDEYWSMAASPYADQAFYLYSPYSRKDNQKLLASALYPICYDSIGFPGMMSTVARRLDSSAICERNSNVHYLVYVTYNGETRSYGGAGSEKGQGLSADKLTHIFTLDENDEITFGNLRQLLTKYANTKMEDDSPHEYALTWADVCNTVGDEGAWIKLTDGYTFLWKRDDEEEFNVSEFGTGDSRYIDGSLDYCDDTWVDGRYINNKKKYVPGEVFEDHQQSDIVLLDQIVPVVSYDWSIGYNEQTSQRGVVYSNIEVTTTTKTVRYKYNSYKEIWTADLGVDQSDLFIAENVIVEMAEQGLIDEKYLDMIELTYEEVTALNVDRNTDIAPEYGYIYDGTVEPGTEFNDTAVIQLGDVNQDGSINATDAAVILQESALIGATGTGMFTAEQNLAADVNGDAVINASDAAVILTYSANIGAGNDVTIEEIVNNKANQ